MKPSNFVPRDSGRARLGTLGVPSRVRAVSLRLAIRRPRVYTAFHLRPWVASCEVRVVSFFGVTDNADTPEEVMILQESSDQVDRANELLSQLPQASPRAGTLRQA